jgi:nucleotide-binding universal stress UspA family protein
MRILLAVDDSEHSGAAAKSVLERPWPPRSTVRVLSVAQSYIPLPGPYGGLGAIRYEDVEQSFLKAAQEVVERTVTQLAIRGLAIESSVKRGDARQEIVEEAKDWRADLIIVGSHGRTGVQRWLLGSVAEHIVRHAPCSVEVVRKPPER